MGARVKLHWAQGGIGTLQRRLSIACRHLNINAGKVAQGTEPKWFQDIMKEKVDGDDGDESDLDDDAEDDEAEPDDDDARSEGASSESCLHWAQGRCEHDRCQYRHTMDLDSGYKGASLPAASTRVELGRGDAETPTSKTKQQQEQVDELDGVDWQARCAQ